MAEDISPAILPIHPNDTPLASTSTAAKPGAHLFRICNKEHLETGCTSNKANAETSEEAKGKTDDLPEGWVRHGKGLMLDVPITPRMRAGSSSKVQEPHFNFTKDSETPYIKQLHGNLIQIDRDAVRKMRGAGRGVMIKASRPSSDGTPCHYTRIHATPQRHVPDTRREDSMPGTNEQTNRKIAALKKEHTREVLQAKQQVLEQVDGLVRKYRQLAIDAVKVAREEQRKAELERRNAYDACTRYEADLKANVKQAIAHLKESAQVEQERLVAERDALQRKCGDMMHTQAAYHRPKLDHITGEIASQFRNNINFSIGMIDETRTMIHDEFEAFKHTMAELMVEKFAAQGCSLRSEDAETFVESSLLADSLLI